MTTNSQDGYTVSFRDDDSHPLQGMPPSIEEIVLSKCDKLTKRESEQFDRSPPYSPEREAFIAKQRAWDECQTKELTNLRYAAWDRFTERLANKKCNWRDYDQNEIAILTKFFATPSGQRSDDKKSEVISILDKHQKAGECSASMRLELLVDADRPAEEQFPRELSLDCISIIVGSPQGPTLQAKNPT
jgi:hypothetical protein